MKIAFFGTPEFAVPSLKKIFEAGIKIEAVFTQPDRKVGRKQEIQKPAVKVAAEALGLKILQPENKSELEEQTAELDCDFFVVIAYGMIFSQKVLNQPHICCLNSHASILPKYRGASPIQQSLLNGDKDTGISYMQMDSKMDHGAIFHIEKVEINNADNLLTLSKKLAQAGAEKLPSILQKIKSGELVATEQDHDKATYCNKIEKSDGKIDWSMSAEGINNKLRAFTPWPGIFTEYNGKKIKILSLEIDEGKKHQAGDFFIENKALKIQAKDKVLIPTNLQMEGKKANSNQEFLNGNRSFLGL